MESQQHLAFIWFSLRQGWSAAHSSHVSHPSAWCLLLQTGGPLPAARVLVETGKTPFLPGPEVALFKGLQDVAVQTFDDELDKILPVGQSALEKPHYDHMVCKGDSVVVELEGVCVGKSDCKHHEKLRLLETSKNLNDEVERKKKRRGAYTGDLWKRDQRGKKLKDGDGNVHCGRYLAKILQHLEQIS